MITGQIQQRRELSHLIERSLLPSTLLLHGPAGTGKQLVARELARTILCERSTYGGCSNCSACSLVDSSSHPDLHEMDAALKDEAKVDEIRKVLQRLALSSYLGKGRVLIIHNVEFLNVQASNSLLKSLEEPRPNLYFVLTSSNPSRIISTIHSRCHTFFFDRLSQEEVSEILAGIPESATSPIPIDEQVALADGTLENISLLLQHPDEWQSIKDELVRISKGDLLTAVEVARGFPKDRGEQRAQVVLMRIFAQKMMRSSEGKERLRWALCLENMLYAEYLIFDRNLAVQQVLTSLLVSLARTPGKFTHLTHDGTLLEDQVAK